MKIMLGSILEKYGVVAQNDNHKVVHLSLQTGEKIPAHAHAEENAYFTVVKGKMKVFLNEQEEYIITPGKSLSFDGVHSISAEALENSDIFVFLIKKV